MLAADSRAYRTYAVISGGLNEDDMVVKIDGRDFLVVLRPEPGTQALVYGYQPQSDIPGSEPVGEWDHSRQRMGLWDEYGNVESWYIAEPAQRFDGRWNADGDYSRAPPRTIKRIVRRVRLPPDDDSDDSIGEAYEEQLSSDADFDDPIPEDPAKFTLTPRTHNAKLCFDLVLPVRDFALGGQDGSNPEASNSYGITWGEDQRSGRMYVRAVDESLLQTVVIPSELSATHSRPNVIQWCYLLAVNRRSARLLSREMLDARMRSAQSDDTRWAGLVLTFQSEPKFRPREAYLNPRLTFVGSRFSGYSNAEGPITIRRAGSALDIEVCPASDPQSGAKMEYRVTMDVFLALRRRRLLYASSQRQRQSESKCLWSRRSHQPVQLNDVQQWARSLRELRKERDMVEFATRRDRYSHKGREHELHFHGSKPPGCVQCGSRRGRGDAGKTVAYRRRYAARHLKGRVYHTWERKTLCSMRVKRFCSIAEFRAKRYHFDYWLDVAIDWMKTAQGRRRRLPPEQARRQETVRQLPPDTVRRLREGAATQVVQGLTVWEYRLLSFYFDKLRRLRSDTACRCMNYFRLRRVIEAWHFYVSHPAWRELGGTFGLIDVPKRAVGARRQLRSSRPVDVWNDPADARQLSHHRQDDFSRRGWSQHSSRIRVHHRLVERGASHSRRLLEF